MSAAPFTDWPCADRELIEWFGLHLHELPRQPFAFRSGESVADPRLFLAALCRDVLHGPHGPRARRGALQLDLARLRALFGENAAVESPSQRRLFADDGTQAQAAGELVEIGTKTVGTAAAIAVTDRAAAAIAATAAALEAELYAFVRRRGEAGATDAEMQAALELAPEAQRPPRRRLGRDGLIRDSGTRRAIDSDRPSVVWVATDKPYLPEPRG